MSSEKRSSLTQAIDAEISIREVLRHGTIADIQTVRDWVEQNHIRGIVGDAVAFLFAVSGNEQLEWLRQLATSVDKAGRLWLAILQHAPDSCSIDLATRYALRADQDDFALAELVLELLAKNPSPALVGLGEAIVLRGESFMARNELVAQLIRRGSSVASEDRLMSLIENSNSGDLLIGLVHCCSSGVVVRAAKKYLILHAGSVGSAFLLKALLTNRKLRNERKHVDYWFLHAERKHLPLMIEIFCAYFDRPKPTKHAFYLARKLGGYGKTPQHVYAIRMLLLYEKSQRTRRWLTEYIESNFSLRKTASLLVELIAACPDRVSAELAFRWLTQNPAHPDLCFVLTEAVESFPEDRFVSLAEQKLAAEEGTDDEMRSLRFALRE